MGDLLPLPTTPDEVLVSRAELDRLRDVERLAAVLTTAIYHRRARDWHKVPMREAEQLAEALLAGHYPDPDDRDDDDQETTDGT